MLFSKLVENTPETTVSTTILGVLLSQGLTVSELGVLGRLIIYFGEAVLTIAVLQAARDAEEMDKIKQNELVTSDENDETKILLDGILGIINQLQLQNQNLQEQIWALQEKCP